MKTVFSNSMCAHVWAQLSQPHGRSGSMKFDGAVAYSYQTPVAHIAHTPNGKRVALFVPNSWGVTTARHLAHYRDAVTVNMPYFEVPDIFDWQRTRFESYDHKANLAYLTEQYSDEVASLMRLPSDSYRLQNVHVSDDLRELAHTLQQYADTFKLDVEALPWMADRDAVIARRDRLLNDPKRAAKREAATRARVAKEAREMAEAFERNQEYIAKWRAGEGVHTRVADATGGALLRISPDGTRVQTSWGAEVPVAHAKRVLAFYQIAPRPWTRAEDMHRHESHTLLGHFQLDVIGADGSIRAGCHTIHAAEIEHLKTLLG